MAPDRCINRDAAQSPGNGFVPLKPGQEHDLPAEAAGVNSAMDLARRRDRQSVDNDGMEGALAQQIEQGGHVRLELFGVRHAAIGDAVPHRATTAEQEAQCVPHLQPGKAEPRSEQAFAPTAMVCDP